MTIKKNSKTSNQSGQEILGNIQENIHDILVEELPGESLPAQKNVHDTKHMIDNIEEDIEINYDLIASGPLYVDPKHKKPGYQYLFVSDRPGEIEMYKKLGYSIVQDEFAVGDNTASTTSKFGSAITVQSKCGAILVLMAITQKNFDRYEEYKRKRAQEQLGALGSIQGVSDEYQQVNGQKLGYIKTFKPKF